MSLLSVENLSFSIDGTKLLENISFSLEKGSLTLVAGKNGSGKSMLLKCLKGLERPDQGVIEIDGRPLKKERERMKAFGLVFQDTSLEIVGSTVKKDIAFGLENMNHSRDNIQETTDKMISLFNLEKIQDRPPSVLSGGEKRRLYLLTILMKNPNLLILDEPTNDLDIVTLNILEEYLKEYGGSLIIVSHDRHFLDRVVEHLLVFCGDGIVKDFIGTFSEYRSYVRDYEASQKKEPSEPKPAEPAKAQKAPDNKPRKLSFKEKRELELIESRLPELEELKKTIETDMNSGTLAYDKLSEKAEEFKRISSEIDELETRWLELQNQ